MAPRSSRRVLTVLLAVLALATAAQARKATGGVFRASTQLARQNTLHDAAHGSRKLTLVRDAKSGRTGVVHDRSATAKAHTITTSTVAAAPAAVGPLGVAPTGRRLQQASGNTALVPGMSMCPSALDAASFIVGAHATQMTVSNAAFTAGVCSPATWAANTYNNGLMWGVVTTWPADHAMALMFANAGALVLGSGDVAEAQRVVNDADGFTADNQLAGDPDLDALIPGYTTYDAVALEFDVVPAKSGELVFSYVFASEEYNEYVDSPFNDVFGFFVSGPGISNPVDGSNRLNIAYLPDWITPVSINNINNGKYSQFFSDNDADPRPTVWPPASAFNTSYDGFTSLLTTRPVSVLAGQRYHFKLALADAGDHVLDSAVWIAGGSLLVNNPPTVTEDGPYTMACPGSVTMHGNATDEDHDAISYRWNLTSTTDPNLHIAKTTSAPTLTSPDDAIPPGNYSVVLTAVDSHGSRASARSTLQVLPCPAPATNRPPVAVVGGPYTLPVCNGAGAITLDASASSDPDAASGDAIKGYVWEISSASGDFELKLSGPVVTVGAQQQLFAGNSYEVEVFVRDSYGASSVAETTLTVIPGPGCASTGGSGGGGGGGGGGSGTFTEAKITGGPFSMPTCTAVVTLDGSASTSFDGAGLTYAWTFEDPDTKEVFSIPSSTAATTDVSMAAFPWLQAGLIYDVTLAVTDSAASVAIDSTNFAMPATCNQPPTAATTASSYTVPGCAGQVVLDGSPSSDPDAGDTLTFSWQIFAKGTTATPLAVGSSAQLAIAYNTVLPAGATFDAYLTVTDAAGASSTAPKVTVLAPACNRPPVAKISGAPYSLACAGSTQLDGTASTDPDGNDDIASYTFLVRDATTLALVASKPAPGGKVTVAQVTDALATNKVYLLELEVADKAGAIGRANTTLTAGNCKPVAVAKITPSASVACGGTVTLDGSGSTDSDGTIATWAWKCVSGASSVSKSGVTAALSQTTDKLTAGASYNCTLTVTDNKGATSSAVTPLAVGLCASPSPSPPPSPAPNRAPVCTYAVANVTRISTLNHAMVPVTVLNVSDPDVGDKVTIAITGITQDEGTKLTDTVATGFVCPDASYSGATAKLAAEGLASPAGNGRVYRVSFKATDSKGLTCTGAVKVCAKTGTTGTCTEDTKSVSSTVCA